MSGLRVGGVLLAAGRGERCNPHTKLLLELDGEPLVRRAARALVESGLGPLVLVTGHEGDRVAGALSGLPFERVHDDAHALAMGRSLAAGVRALGERVDAAVLALGDMPWVSARHVSALRSAFHPETGDVACAPVYAGRRGHPVLFGARLFSELRRLEGDEGARAILARHAASVRAVPVEDDGVLRDVDRLGDLATPRNAQ